LYEGCALAHEHAGHLGCLSAHAIGGTPCTVCVGPAGHVISNDCSRPRPGPRVDCDVEHKDGKVCVRCERDDGDEHHDQPSMCMDDDPRCPPENPDGGAPTPDAGEGGGPTPDAGVDAGEGGGPTADAGADAGEGGGTPPTSLACAPVLPSTSIYCNEINTTFSQLGISYAYGCDFAGAYLPPALDQTTREAIDVWLAAHDSAVNPAAPPCEALLAMATSWSCEEEGDDDDDQPAELRCGRRVGRQRLSGYARAQMIRDGACRP
jgi:hypothetical protein